MLRVGACVTLTGNMDEPTSILVCGLIAGVLTSDQDMDIHEAGFLQRIRKRFGVSKGVPVQPIVEHDDAIAKLQGLPEDVQRETLALLIQAAAADGKIAPEERSFLGVVADKLQVEPDKLDERLEKALAMSKPQPFAPAVSRDDD